MRLHGSVNPIFNCHDLIDIQDVKLSLDLQRWHNYCFILCCCFFSSDLASLARAAVSGDESALDMFTWQKGKVNPKMSLATMGPQEALTFFLGGRNGRLLFTFHSILYLVHDMTSLVRI